ncbi:MAG: hypothetical protein Q9P01_03455 [Anaerolineae bacterium]|nr:hypothetical protein [Anaerolineae bacterium]MDQ7033909.1 hypothetical protein [Anaerolineae bacterium]
MIDEKEMLVDGERRLGRYTIVLLQQTNSGEWQPALMQLDATVTNYRLLLRPFRKKYTPACLPSHYIKSIQQTVKGKHHCVEMHFITNHFICMMLSTGRLENLYDDLSAMKQPPPRFAFDDKVARKDIERLITYFGREPLPVVAPESTND